MATKYVAPKGTVAAGGNGSLATPWNGILEMTNALAGSTAVGDTIEFMGNKGPFGLADAADFPNVTAINAALNSGTLSSGIKIGTAYGTTSPAAGRIFQFRGSTGQAIVDMRGATMNSQRMTAALTFLGEGIQVLNPWVYCPTWAYLLDPADGSTRIAGPSSNPEQLSIENIGIQVHGNGGVVDGARVIGWTATHGGWSRAGIFCNSANAAVGSTSPRLTNIVRNCKVTGCMNGVYHSPGGAGGYDMAAGQRLKVHNNELLAPVWGARVNAPIDEFNAGSHGNGVEVIGKFGGGMGEVYNNHVSGNWQDGIDLASSYGTIAYNNYLHDIGDATLLLWQWNASTSRWNVGPVTNTNGNGIKLGLSSMDGTGPTVWMGTDGVAGGSLNVPEQLNAAVGNRIYRVNALGVASNTAKGCYIHANEIVDAKSVCISLLSLGAVGNQCVTHNYCKLSSDAPANSSAVVVGTNNRVVFANNIVVTDPTKSHFEVNWPSSTGIVKGVNLMATGRFAGGNYSTTNDLANRVPTWTPGVGLPAGDAALTAGTRALWQTTKHFRAHADMWGVPFDQPPPLGPYRPAFTRSSRS